MTIRQNVNLAFKAIKGNILRTILTLLVIAIGIMALVAILTSIDALKASLSDNFSGMGSNSFSIIPKGTGIQVGGPRRKRDFGPDISFKQAENFKQRYTYPSFVSISVISGFNAKVAANNKETNPNVMVFGVDENYLQVQGYNIEVGRNFTPNEANNTLHLALIGPDIVKQLFNGENTKALDKVISVDGLTLKVIGVLASKGSSMSFSGDRSIMIPLQLARQESGGTGGYNLTVGVNNATDIEPSIAEATGLFRGLRKLGAGEDNDFEFEKSDGLIDIIVENTKYLQLAAIFIGLITLMGAAVGLMNIMLVSVTERTREIGVCKSLGATKKNIQVQFLTEAVVICQIGGILGVLLGIIAGNLVSFALGSTFIIPWAWIVLGLFLCFIVGIVSGIYPAIKASNLDPIEALRHE